MPRPLSLISINVENSKHVESVRNFLKASDADVICFQELLEAELMSLQKELAMEGHFFPMTLRPRDDNGRLEKEGLAIFSRYKILRSEVDYYRGDAANLKVWNKDTTEKLMESVYACAGKIVIEFESEEFSIATTHFTWSPDGLPNVYQRADLQKLLAVLEGYGSFILCGDFNAPRGGEIFGKIASIYKDNIPAEYESSLDPKLHRRPDLKLMVDGLFSTPDYAVGDVRLVSGLSDHLGIIANITKI